MHIARKHGTARRTPVGWYIRLVLYIAVLIAVVVAMNSLRGQIPQAFGLTPVRVDVLAVHEVPVVDPRSPERDYSVTVRIVGRKTPPAPLTLDQFELQTGRKTTYRPYASEIVFADAGTLRVAEADTIVGVMVFTILAGEEPRELWWRP